MTTDQLIGVYLFYNLVAFILMGDDKFRSKHRKFRIPVWILLLFGSIGVIGLQLGMIFFNHKKRIMSFQIVAPVVTMLDAVLFYFFKASVLFIYPIVGIAVGLIYHFVIESIVKNSKSGTTSEQHGGGGHEISLLVLCQSFILGCAAGYYAWTNILKDADLHMIKKILLCLVIGGGVYVVLVLMINTFFLYRWIVQAGSSFGVSLILMSLLRRFLPSSQILLSIILLAATVGIWLLQERAHNNSTTTNIVAFNSIINKHDH